jgi:hypothetical protein
VIGPMLLERSSKVPHSTLDRIIWVSLGEMGPFPHYVDFMRSPSRLHSRGGGHGSHAGPKPFSGINKWTCMCDVQEKASHSPARLDDAGARVWAPMFMATFSTFTPSLP